MPSWRTRRQADNRRTVALRESSDPRSRDALAAEDGSRDVWTMARNV